MSHNLELKKDGTTSFVSNGEKAWHGLGTYVEKAMTAAEAIKLSNMDYTVDKKAIQMIGSRITIPGKVATYRTDTKVPLGVVGEGYEIIQNRDAFSFFDTIIDKDEAIYETAGVLGKGERIFVTAKLPADINVKGDKIEKYILLTTSHDMSRPLQAGFTPIRVVCNNTLTAALKDLTNKVTVRHTKSAKEKIVEAARVMGLCSSYMQFLDTTFNKMAKVKITDQKLKEYILQVLNPGKEIITKEKLEKEYSTRSENVCDEIMDFAKTHETQLTDATKKTLFGAYNSISGYFNFTKEYESIEAKMQDVFYNGTANKVARAFELAIKMS